MFYGHIGNPSELIRFYFTNFRTEFIGKKGTQRKIWYTNFTNSVSTYVIEMAKICHYCLTSLFQKEICKIIKLGYERWVKLKQTKCFCRHFREKILRGKREHSNDHRWYLKWRTLICLYYGVHTDKSYQSLTIGMFLW